ncbi:MAG: hypothetical protein AAGB06_07180 [Verrucomicrobiota bacterium]
MNSQEAKFTLQSYRPGTEDDNDPLFREALSMVEHDPELARWFDEDSRFDAEVRAKLAEIEPPSELPATILAGMRASAIHASREIDEILDERVATTRRSFWLRPETISIAALFIILFAWADPFSMRGFRAEPGAAGPHVPAVLAQFTDHYETFPGFELESNNLDDLKAYFQENGISSPEFIPASLAENTPMGCVSIDVNGNAVGMICFRDGLDVMHLYSVPEEAFEGELPGDEPAIIEDRGRGYKMWKQDELVYVLATEGKTDRLKEFF